MAVNDKNKEKIAEAERIPTILSAMRDKTHLLNAQVQHYGCAALWTLAVNDKNKETIAEAESIPTILSAMKFNKYNAKVQHYGCAALWLCSTWDLG